MNVLLTAFFSNNSEKLFYGGSFDTGKIAYSRNLSVDCFVGHTDKKALPTNLSVSS